MTPRARLLLLLLSLALAGGRPAAAGPREEDGPRVERLVERYAADEGALRRFYPEPLSRERSARLRSFLDDWQQVVEAAAPQAHGVAEAIDLRLLRNHLDAERDELDEADAHRAELEPLLPCAAGLLALDDGQRGRPPLEARAVAETLARLAADLAAARARVEAGRAKDAPADALKVGAPVALRAARAAQRLARLLEHAYGVRADFEPGFAWWVREPYERLHKALGDYAGWLRKTVAGVRDGDEGPPRGEPIGREALCRALRRELIPYTPEELLAIAEEEFAWCEAEGRKVVEELGAKDWKDAVERVKLQFRAPGDQDALVAEQAREIVAFLEDRDLLTVPQLAAETWRLGMIDQRGQKTLPFAVYNDQHMMVAYATGGMSHEGKLQSMRGNNEHFTRIVTPHELIPGHHLQLFMAQRHHPYRSLFRTPFLVEGWALHWEMLLWDLGWARGPEDRVGMLFWRRHRCARILVTLGFHLGRMSPQQMIDLLVERVGLEKDGATGEVRRYLGGAYGPLYQCAYMVGGLQLRALHHELVGGGVMGNREFHDAVLRQGSIPVAMIRAALKGEAPPLTGGEGWRFRGDVPVADTPPCPR